MSAQIGWPVHIVHIDPSTGTYVCKEDLYFGKPELDYPLYWTKPGFYVPKDKDDLIRKMKENPPF